MDLTFEGGVSQVSFNEGGVGGLWMMEGFQRRHIYFYFEVEVEARTLQS